VKRIAVIAALVAATLVVMSASTVRAAEVPADRVVAMYFHRTERCPTCLKMGSYAEEAVKKGFAKRVKEKSVQFYYIDFQDKKNAALTKGYKVSGPALIVAKIKAKKVKEFKDLKDIWTHVREKPKFLKYVRDNVQAYQKSDKKPATDSQQGTRQRHPG
jgi:thiol-disulfide isomerase/thioredoxin